MLCQAAETELAGRLRPGLTPEDCESAFVPAAAWMVLAWLQAGEAGVASFTAGNLTIHQDRAGRGGADCPGGAADGPLSGGRWIFLSGGGRMMEREWAALLARYGQSVALHRGEETVRTQAFLQAVTERDRAQEAPSPLGPAAGGPLFISRKAGGAADAGVLGGVEWDRL